MDAIFSVLAGNPPSDGIFTKRNANLIQCTEQEALDLLRAARIVGCRAQSLGNASGVFPLHKLPSEFCIRVLSMLAPHLDREQLTNVLRWVCCAEKSDTAARDELIHGLQWKPRCPTVGLGKMRHEVLIACQLARNAACVRTGSVLRRRHVMSFVESTSTSYPSLAGWYSHLLQSC